MRIIAAVPFFISLTMIAGCGANTPRAKQAAPSCKVAAPHLVRLCEFQASMIAYRPSVTRDNRLEIGAASKAFDSYLTKMHEQIHPKFANGFLAHLPIQGPLANPKLITRIEFAIAPDGSVERMGIYERSGLLAYDFGVYTSMKQIRSFPPPPADIRSADGLVYVHWYLHRGDTKCGMGNAYPSVLR